MPSTGPKPPSAQQPDGRAITIEDVPCRLIQCSCGSVPVPWRLTWRHRCRKLEVRKMRAQLGVVLLLFSCTACAQSNAGKHASPPLTAEQLGVYRAFIDGYRSKFRLEQVLFVDYAGALAADEGDHATCMKGFPRSAPKQSARRRDTVFQRSCQGTLIR